MATDLPAHDTTVYVHPEAPIIGAACTCGDWETSVWCDDRELQPRAVRMTALAARFHLLQVRLAGRPDA